MKLNKGDRVKVLKIVLPIVCHAHGNASRFRRRLHIAEAGCRKPATKKEAHGFDASRGVQVGMPLNPTGILLCGLQGGEHVPGEFDRLLGDGDWCETCRASLRSWVDVNQIRDELS